MSENGRTTRIAFFGISDMGLKRTNNEDRFLVADLTQKMLGVQDNRVIPRMVYHEIGPRGTLLAVADGPATVSWSRVARPPWARSRLPWNSTGGLPQR